MSLKNNLKNRKIINNNQEYLTVLFGLLFTVLIVYIIYGEFNIYFLLNIFTSSQLLITFQEMNFRDIQLLLYFLISTIVTILIFRVKLSTNKLKEVKLTNQKILSFLLGSNIIPLSIMLLVPSITLIFIPCLVISIVLVIIMIPYAILGEFYNTSKTSIITLINQYMNIIKRPRTLVEYIAKIILGFPFILLVYHLLNIDFFVNTILSQMVKGNILIFLKFTILLLICEIYLRIKEFYQSKVKRIDKYSLGDVYWNMGLVYHSKGEYNNSIDYLEKSMDFFKAKHDLKALNKTLTLLIIVNIDLGLLKRAESYYNELELLLSKYNNKINQNFVKLAQGYILKTKPRLQEKGEALAIFSALSSAKMEIAYFKSLSLFCLSELLIFELQSTGADNVFQEALETLEVVSEITKAKDSPLLLIRINQLKSRFKLIEGDLQTADELLTQALMIAEENGLNTLILKLHEEQQSFHNEMKKWTRLIEQNAPLKERIEEATLKDYLSAAMEIRDKNQ